MGIFYDHGICYCVILNNLEKNNEGDDSVVRKIVVKSKDLDDRLVKSEYYTERKHLWFLQDELMYMLHKPKAISKIDIELTSEETDRLNKILEEEDYIHHSFYEIVEMEVSL